MSNYDDSPDWMKIGYKKKKSNLLLVIVFLIIVSFFLYVAYRNEKTQIYTPVPEEKIKIKQPPEIVVPVDNATQGKG